MFLYNDDLRLVHYLKECYMKYTNIKYFYQRSTLWDWVKATEKLSITKYKNCAKTCRNWSEGILNIKTALNTITERDS